jgi:hypothetical protein
VQYAVSEIFENNNWVFPEEFLRELAAAQVRRTQKLVKDLGKALAVASNSNFDIACSKDRQQMTFLIGSSD